MSKLLNIIVLFFIIFMLCSSSFVHATSINMNLTDNPTSTDNTTVENSVDNTDTLAPESTYMANSAIVSTLNDLPESELGLTNILNIILVVIGVLLILLAIAIIIRLGH